MTYISKYDSVMDNRQQQYAVDNPIKRDKNIPEVKAIVTDIQIAGLDKRALTNLAKKYAAQGVIGDISMFVDIAYRYNKARADKAVGVSIFSQPNRKGKLLPGNTSAYLNFKDTGDKFEAAIYDKKIASSAAQGIQGGELNSANEKVRLADARLNDAKDNFFMAKDKYDSLEDKAAVDDKNVLNDDLAFDKALEPYNNNEKTMLEELKAGAPEYSFQVRKGQNLHDRIKGLTNTSELQVAWQKSADNAVNW